MSIFSLNFASFKHPSQHTCTCIWQTYLKGVKAVVLYKFLKYPHKKLEWNGQTTFIPFFFGTLLLLSIITSVWPCAGTLKLVWARWPHRSTSLSTPWPSSNSLLHPQEAVVCSRSLHLPTRKCCEQDPWEKVCRKVSLLMTTRILVVYWQLLPWLPVHICCTLNNGCFV